MQRCVTMCECIDPMFMAIPNKSILGSLGSRSATSEIKVFKRFTNGMQWPSMAKTIRGEKAPGSEFEESRVDSRWVFEVWGASGKSGQNDSKLMPII